MGNPRGVERDFDQLESRRLKAAALFEKGLSQAEVSRKLNVHRQSVSRWHAAWSSGGKKALRQAGRAGRKARLSEEQLEGVRRGLQEGPEVLGYGSGLWTCWRVADLIQRQTGEKYHPGHVWRVLRSLGWSCQRPIGKATQRDEAAILRWKKRRWPELKKKPVKTGKPSSSSTKAV